MEVPLFEEVAHVEEVQDDATLTPVSVLEKPIPPNIPVPAPTHDLESRIAARLATQAINSENLHRQWQREQRQMMEEMFLNWRKSEDARREAESRDRPKAPPEKPATPAHPPAPSVPRTPPPAPSESDEGEIPDSDEEDTPEPSDPCSDGEPEDVGEPVFPMPSPPDDQCQFNELMGRVAAKFAFPLAKEEDESTYLLAKLAPVMKTSQQIPVDPHILKKGMEVLRKPASVVPTGPRQEKKYKAPSSDPLFLRGTPPPDSMIVAAARRKAQLTPAGTATPSDRENKRMDTMGRKICSAASLAVREASTSAVIARYDRDMWDTMADFIQHLPEEHQQDATNVVAEGRLCANHGLKTALDSADGGFRTMAMGVTMRRQAWLQESVFKTEVQARLADMPFDGTKLFGKEVQETVSTMKVDLESVKAVAGLHQYDRKKPFHGKGGQSKSRQHQSSSSRKDKHWSSEPRRDAPYRGGSRRGRGRGGGGGNGGGNNSKTPHTQK